MTIKEFAKNQGVTQQAIYARLKAAGIEISKLKKENSRGELTADGLEVLKSICSKEGREKDKEKEALKIKLNDIKIQFENSKEENKRLREELEAAKQSAGQWREQAAQQAEAVKTAQAIAAKLQEALEKEQQTAQQAQALNMASIQALKQPPRLSWWQRLTGKREKIPAEAVQNAAEEQKTE